MRFTNSSIELLERTARAMGLPSPALQPTAPDAPIDLADASQLLSLDDEALRRELLSSEGQRVDAVRVGQELSASLGIAKPVALLRSADEAASRIAHAASSRRSGSVLCVGDCIARFALLPLATAAQLGALDDAALAACSLVVLDGDLAAHTMASLAARIRTTGAALCVDETATAFRVANGAACARAGLTPDFALLGASVSCGLPFGAAIGVEETSSADPLSLRIVEAALHALKAAPVSEAIRAHAAQLRAQIEAHSKSQEIRIAFDGDAAMPRLHFLGQEDAPGDLIAQHFAHELRLAGVHSSGPILLTASMRSDSNERQRIANAFGHALVRIRALLVEYNSHLSGGLPWPFATGRDALRSRGLTFYRYPRRAEVDVEPNGEAMRIAFGSGPLGPVTSSGFFVPTRLVGDVTLTIRYALRKWNAGPDSACLGLFFQNEASTARYYAQVISTADAPTARSVAAGLAGNVMGRTPIDGDHGWLRLSRVGSTLTASWRSASDAPWIQLGQCDATSDALIAGCKIWSKVTTDGLVADLYELQIDGELAKEQPELLAAKSDPRRG